MSSTTILQVDDIEVVYEQAILAVRGVSLSVKAGQVVALLGANGAGKSTTLKTVSHLIRAERGEMVRGRVFYQGEDIGLREPAALVAGGLVQVLEGRHCFPHLTVEENLLSGAFVRKVPRQEIRKDLERIYNYFPRLKLKRKSQAGYTSGGEQQMLAIGRALMTHPRMVLLDEPSMGLAPQVVEEIFELIVRLQRSEGLSFLIAEQNIHVALRCAQYAYVMENGRVVSEGDAQALAAREDIHDFYLGGQGAVTDEDGRAALV